MTNPNKLACSMWTFTHRTGQLQLTAVLLMSAFIMQPAFRREKRHDTPLWISLCDCGQSGTDSPAPCPAPCP